MFQILEITAIKMGGGGGGGGERRKQIISSTLANSLPNNMNPKRGAANQEYIARNGSGLI